MCCFLDVSFFEGKVLALKYRFPLVIKLRLIGYLIVLKSGVNVSSSCRSFVVNYFGGRLKDYSVALSSSGKAQVGIFVICRRVASIKATNLIEQVFSNQKRSSGTVIHVAGKDESRIVR